MSIGEAALILCIVGVPDGCKRAYPDSVDDAIRYIKTGGELSVTKDE